MNPVMLILILVVCLVVFGGLGYSGGWHSSYPQAYWGGGGVGLVVIVILIIFLIR
jgi:hypothetical protein